MAVARKKTPVAQRANPSPTRPASPAAKAPATKTRVPAKTSGTAAPTPSKPPKSPPAVKPSKVKKPKLVRDSFTIPKIEYGVLENLKQRAATLGSPAKKSELLRAGIKALDAMSDAVFKAALSAVPAIKTGRPAKG